MVQQWLFLAHKHSCKIQLGEVLDIRHFLSISESFRPSTHTDMAHILVVVDIPYIIPYLNAFEYEHILKMMKFFHLRRSGIQLLRVFGLLHDRVTIDIWHTAMSGLHGPRTSALNPNVSVSATPVYQVSLIHYIQTIITLGLDHPKDLAQSLISLTSPLGHVVLPQPEHCWRLCFSLSLPWGVTVAKAYHGC